MPWKILALLLVLSPGAFAADPLVKEMEVEIQIRDLGKAAYAKALERVRAAIKQTTLWKRLERIEKEMGGSPGCFMASQALLKFEMKLQGSMGFKEFMRRERAGDFAHHADQLARLRKVNKKSCDNPRDKITPARIARDRVLSRQSKNMRREVEEIEKRFVRRAFTEEMTKRLKALGIEVKKREKAIQRSYKRLAI